MIDFTGRVALVTGAARGIGRATALALAEAGAKVIVSDVRTQIEGLTYDTASATDLDETVELITASGGEALAFSADVRDIDRMRAAVDTATAAWGRLDTIVANAGIAS